MTHKISFKESNILSKISSNYLENPNTFQQFISETPTLENFEKLEECAPAN